MSRIINLPNLKLGSVELNRLQDFVDQQAIYGMVRTYGLMVSNANGGDLGNEWRVEKTAERSIKIMPGKALIKDSYDTPQLIQLLADYDITLDSGLSDLTPINIYVKWQPAYNEAGTISVNNGETLVEGVGTEFTKLFAINRKIIINNVVYGVLSVSDDTVLSLSEPFTDTSVSGVQFSVGGWHSPAAVGVDDSRIYQHSSYSIIVTTSAKAADEYWIASVLLDQGEIAQVTDKRHENIAEMFNTVSRRSALEVLYKKYFNMGIRSENNNVTINARLGFGMITAAVASGILTISAAAGSFSDRTLVNMGMFLDFQRVNSSTIQVFLPENWSAVSQYLEIEIYERWDQIGLFESGTVESTTTPGGAEYIGQYVPATEVWQRIPQPYTEIFTITTEISQFTLSREFIAGAARVFVNGVRQDDFTEDTVAKSVQLGFTPNSGDKIIIDYFA